MTAARREQFAEPAITRGALMERLARHLQPLDAPAIARAVNGNERSAQQWQDGRALPSALYLSRLRALLPGLDDDLRRLEAADRYAGQAHAAQFGARAPLQDGD